MTRELKRIIDDEAGTYLGVSIEAPVDMAERIANLRPEGNDNRSPWMWFRLSNGDLILGFYPQGDTYFETEADPLRP